MDLDRPVAMLNLIRFRERAEYSPADGEEPCTGAQAYERYRELVTPLVEAVGGKPMLSRMQSMIGEGDEWDLSFLVFYPSGRAFLSMVNDPSYHAVSHHRQAAVADSRATLMQFDDPAVGQIVAEIMASQS
ncbi:DUF1330 domain-containing protein [Novosphingobium pentaromativorans]|nr:DUF1330 domain-containing protein [Novosphingobium pentaromativorans]